MITKNFNKSVRRIFDAVLDAARDLDLEVTKKSFSSGRILLKYGGSLLSYGNKIEVTISERKNGVSIKIESTSSATLQLVDWGTNGRLEEELLETIIDILN